MNKIFLKLRRAVKALKTGKFIMRLIDASEVIEDDNIAEVIDNIRGAVKGGRVKITKKNVGAFTFILGIASEMGIIALAELVKEALKEDMLDLEAVEDSEYPPAAA